MLHGVLLFSNAASLYKDRPFEGTAGPSHGPLYLGRNATNPPQKARLSSRNSFSALVVHGP
jgi:hypothetical protein